jgi:hypothetical protein
VKKRTVLLTVALGAACLASNVTPIWPGDVKEAKVKCGGINSCKGKGACKGAANSCAGQNGCKGKGWVEATAKECKDKKGTVITEPTGNTKK